MKKLLLLFLAVMLMALTANAQTTQHDYVDLGLPSGTLWATCNVGANSPEEYGDYFAWGETEPKETYTDANYKFQTDGQMSKYNATDNITELMAGDDAATANWGSDWQMPSKAQMDELIDESNTTIEWTKENGVSGLRVTSTHNGKSIFMPAAGHQTRWPGDVGRTGYYWSRSLNAEQVWESCFMTLDYSGYKSTDYVFRSYGCPVRPVLKKDKSGSLNGHDYVDLALPSGTLWATTNVGGEAPESCGPISGGMTPENRCGYFKWGEYGDDSIYGDEIYYLFYNHNAGYIGFTKYVTQSRYGSRGFTDNLTELLPEDDAATYLWGSEWQTPSVEQLDELIDENYTKSVWTTLNGVNGIRITSKSNGNSIFLPAGGYGYGYYWNYDDEIVIHDVGDVGCYWSRTLYAEHNGAAYYLTFYSSNISTGCEGRTCGQNVRAVLKSDVPVYPAGDVNNDGTVDIADVVAVLNAMAGGTAQGNADVNNDTAVDIADVVAVLSIMAGK